MPITAPHQAKVSRFIIQEKSESNHLSSKGKFPATSENTLAKARSKTVASVQVSNPNGIAYQSPRLDIGTMAYLGYPSAIKSSTPTELCLFGTVRFTKKCRAPT
jgi:hypothetical protein